MIIAIAGASGMIGRALARSLEGQGHEVRRLGRMKGDDGNWFRWDPSSGQIDTAALTGVDAVVNLAGANIAGGRWTDTRKQVLRDSRVLSTRLLSSQIARLEQRPPVMVNASGAGLYGITPEGWVDERSPRGNGFLAGLCAEWESSSGEAAKAGCRVVHVRLGVVLSPAGGALAKMIPPFRMGLGGPIGDGSAWLSWISLVDAVRVFERVIGDASIRGAVNGVTPNPVTNAEFAAALGKALGKPARFRTPAALLKVGFGQMAEETVLASARVRPSRLLDAGFEFMHPTIDAALTELVGGRS